MDEYISQKQKVASNLGKSALLPGMGQFSCKRVVKGGVFLGTTIVAFGGGVYFLLQSNDKYEQYKEADNIDDIEKYWNESEKLLKYSKILAGAGAVIWFINLIDIYLTTNRYNEALFKEFYFGLGKGSFSPRIGVNNNKIEIKLVYEY